MALVQLTVKEYAGIRGISVSAIARSLKKTATKKLGLPNNILPYVVSYRKIVSARMYILVVDFKLKQQGFTFKNNKIFKDGNYSKTKY